MRKRLLAMFLAFTMTVNSSEMIFAAGPEGVLQPQEQELYTEESAGEMDTTSEQTETTPEESEEETEEPGPDDEGAGQGQEVQENASEVQEETIEEPVPENSIEPQAEMLPAEEGNTAENSLPESSAELQSEFPAESEAEVQSELPTESGAEMQAEDSGFVFSGGIITGYTGSESAVVIPDEIDGVPVTEIGRYAFSNNQTLESIVIGQNVTLIYPEAFEGCNNLKTVRFLGNQVPQGYYGNHCLYYARNLETIYVPVEAYASYHSVLRECLENSVLLKTNTGEEFIVEEDVLIGYAGEAEEVTLPENIIRIGPAAFCGNKTVKRVYLPSGVTEIGEKAFYSCENLEALENYSQIKKINAYAFYNCQMLNIDVAGMENLEEIGESAFEGCSGLTGDLVLPSGLKAVPDGAFSGCTGYSGRLILPEGLETIGEYAFSSCGFTGDLRIPDSVYSIDSYAFLSCSGFNGTLTLPSGLQEISRAVFQDCSGFRDSLSIPEGVENIGDNAFYGCSGFDGSLNLPSALKNIGEYAFASCNGLTGSLVLPDSLTSVGNYAFASCSGFSGSLEIPGVTQWGSLVFQSCTGITSVVFGENAAFSNGSIFNLCSGIKELTLYCPPGSDGGYWSLHYMEALENVYVPSELYSTYMDAWGKDMPENVHLKSLGNEEFIVSEGVLIGYTGEETDITLPEGITEIGENVFRNNKTVEKITFPDGIKKIGAQAFDNSVIKEIINTDSLEEIGEYAFRNCKAFISPVMESQTLTEIGTGAFQYCEALSGTIILPQGLTEIRPYTFQGCSDIRSFELPESIVTIGESAFEECSMLEKINIPENLTSIPSRMLYQCESLEGKLEIPDKVTAIGDYAFYGCVNITGIGAWPPNLQSIGAAAFGSCYNLSGTLELPKELTTIGSSAFNACPQITGELVIPDKITRLEAYLIAGTGIESLVLGQGVSYIGRNVTYNCSSLKSITFRSQEPPEFAYEWEIFNEPANLETIYVPQGSSESYVTAIGNFLPEGVRVIEEGAGDFVVSGTVLVSYNGNDKEVELPSGITEIGDNAFLRNTSLEKVTFCDGITRVGSRAFFGCSNLKEISNAENLESIGEYSFSGCESLTGELTLSDRLVNMGESAFSGCTGITSVVLPEGITRIEPRTFSECYNLESVTFPEGLESIGYQAFELTGLKELEFPESLKVIEEYAFSYCNALTGSIRIPDTVETLSNDTFYSHSGKIEELILGTGIKTVQEYSINAQNFNIIRFTGTEPPAFEGDVLKNLGSDIKVYVPYEVYKEYYDIFSGQGFTGRLLADGGEEFYIENNVLIGYFGNDQDVAIPEGVTEIGSNAFRSNPDLENVILSEGIRVIGDGAFSGCSNLKTVENTAGLIEIGNSAFSNCENMETFDLAGENLERIGDGAFSGCSLLKLPEISNTVNYIGNSAFRNCYSMSGSIKLPENLTTIGGYAFYGCSGLEGNLVIPDKVTYIGDSAFRECGFEGTLELPEGLETIVGYAFYGCQFTGVLKLPEKLTELENGTFSGCRFTGELILPEGMTYLGDNSLDGLNIESIVIGSRMEAIGENALLRCENLTKLVFLGENPPSADDPDFLNNLANLEEIYVPEQSLELYESAYRSRVGEDVVISSDLASIPVSNLQADKVYSGSVHLTWSPAVSEDTTGYVIYRDDLEEPVGKTESTEFTDRNLTTARTYTYSVRPVTETGEEGYASQIEVTPILPQVTGIGTDNFLNKIGVGNGRIYAYVRNLKNLEPLGDEYTVGRFYYEDIFHTRIPIGEPVTEPSSLTETQGVYTIDWDVQDITPGTYTVIFELTDIDGRSAQTSGEIAVDNSVPEKITGLTAIGDTNQIVLSWTMAHELDTERYHIYKKEQAQSDFRLYKRIIGRENLTYTDKNVQPGKKYNYYVVGVNDFGIEGEPSETATAIPAADTEKPRVVKITPVNGSVLSQTAEIYIQSQDNVSVTKTEIHVSADNGATWELLGTSETDNCRVSLDTTGYSDQILLVKGTAYDAAGNVSDSMTAEYQVDNTGPEQVTGLSGESTSTTITLRWKDVADKDFYFFRVEERKAGEETFETCQDVYTTLGANLINLVPGTEHFYRVVAYDRYGNRGIPSEEISVSTQKDTNSPVITSITPEPGYYRDEIPLTIQTQDDAGVEKVIIQISSNGVLWSDVEEIPAEGRTVQVQYNLNLEDCQEGLLYVRGISQDTSGNISDRSSSAPFVQYYVDRTAPAVPGNIQAQGHDGYIEITWDMGTEQDLDDYVLYRSLDGEKFEEYASGLYQTNYIDRDTEGDQTYWYQIAVRDYAGNISQRTQAVQGAVLEDTQAPEIQSVAPASGTVLGQGRKKFSVLASDNRQLKKMTAYYGVNSKENLQELASKENIEDYYYVLETQLPLDSMEDGDKLYIKVTAEDIHRMTAESEIYEYTIDKTAPSLENVQVSGDEEKITVQWTGFQEEDLQGYQIYRKPAGGSYTIVGQKLKEDNQGNYTFHDYTGEVKETYSYKVEAVDTAGNTYSLLSENVWLTAVMKLEAGLVCETWQSVDTEYVFDASSTVSEAGVSGFEIDFGDGQEPVVQTDPEFIHRYSAAGNYQVTLTVTDQAGNQDSYTKEVQVKEPELLGTVKVHVEDADGQSLSGMPVYFDLDNTSDNVRYTDGGGDTEFISQVGKFSVGAYDTNYLPVKRDVVVRSNTATEITLTMVEAPIVTGKFEVDRMTLDEIQAAGIDIADPANQHVMKFTIHLTYTERDKVIEDTFEIAMNDNNETWEIVAPNIPDRHFVTKPLIIDLGDDGGHYEGVGGSSGPAIVAVLDIPAEASFLKEFFDVRLHIINQAGSEFTLSGNQVHLNVPEGMSIVDAIDHSSSADVTFGDLKGQEQATVSWALRGDEQGEYDLSADYQGMLEQFNKAVNATFATDEPIKVYGTSAVKLIAEINSKILYNTLYFNLGIKNKSDIDIYMPSINVEDETIISYKEKKKGSGNWNEDTEVPVAQLASTLMNQEGFSQNIDMETPVEVLAPGETLMNKFAAYSATDYQDIAYLQEAVYEIADEMDVEVEIRSVDMELYNMENAEDKVADIRQDKNKTAFVEEMIDTGNDNYYYVRQAIQADDDLAQNLSEGAYRTLDFIFNFDLSLFTNDDIDKVTREYIRDLLLDEGTTENVDRIVENTEVQVLKSTVDALNVALGAVGGSDAEIVTSALNDTNTFYTLKSEYDSQGQEGLKDGIKDLISDLGVSTGKELLMRAVDEFDFNESIRTSMKAACGNISTVLGVLNDYNTAWSESQELCNIMMTVNANYEEAEFLLRTMAVNIDRIKSFDSRNAVEDTLNDMLSEMRVAMESQIQVFVQEFAKLEGERLGSAAMQEVAVMVFGKQGGIMYNLCKAAFNLTDTASGWGDTVKDIQKVRVAAILSACMKQGVREMWNNPEGQEEDFLRGLKYLFKLRMMGERDYTATADESGNKQEVVNLINKEQGTSYENAYDYYLDIQVWLVEQRDAIYGNKSEVLNVPAAPEVSLDYVNSCTEQSFDSSYEYAIGGENWTDCAEGPIYVTPKDVNQTLWVRVKGTAEHMSGNVTKITIPAMAPLLGDIKAFYDGEKYHVTGLSAGTYSYMFSEQAELEEEWSTQKQFVFSGEETVFQADGEHNYIHLRREASNGSSKDKRGAGFASLIKTVSTLGMRNIQVIYDDTMGTVTGQGVYMEQSQVLLEAVPEEGYVFLGWYEQGNMISDKPQYSFTVTEDRTLKAEFAPEGVQTGTVVVSCDPENTGILQGGGIYQIGASVVIRAEAVQGYNFTGWYDETGSCITTSRTYEFVLDKPEVRYQARYQSLGKAEVTIYSESSKGFLVNGETQQSGYTAPWPKGTEVTLEADNSDGTFAYWTDREGICLSNTPVYTFQVSDITEYYAIYKNDDLETTEVIFLSDYGQVIERKNYHKGEEVSMPVGPSRLGYEFVSWNKTAEEIKTLINAGETMVVVVPVYEKTELKFGLTVTGGSIIYQENLPDSDGKYTYGTRLQIQAEKPEEGMLFSHWEDEDGNILSYRDTYLFMLNKDMTIHGVFVPDGTVPEKKAAIVISGSRAYIEDNVIKVSFSATRDVPDEFTVIANGIIVTDDSLVGRSEDEFILGGENVKTGNSSNKTNKGVHTLSIRNAGRNITWYARGFLTYEDQEGNQYTIYSDIAEETYSE